MIETINKIEEFLSSDDREMIELGARIMQEYMPRRMWKPVLDEYSTKKEIVFTIPQTIPQTGSCTYSIPEEEEVSVQKWTWCIDRENNVITIKLTEPNNINQGIWNQIATGYKHTYTTTNFNINTFSTAVKGYFYGKQKPTNTIKWQYNRKKRQTGWTSLRNK